MALFSKKKNIEVRSDLMAPDSSGVLQSLFGTDTMTKAKALDIPAVNSSIKFIAESVSMIPIKLYREKDGEIDEVVGDNRVRLLNDETGDTLDAVQFWKAIIEDYYLGKGGFAYVNKIGTKIKSLHYIEESHVSVLKNADPIFKNFNYQINGKTYKPYELLSFLRNTKDGAIGTSILTDNNLILSVAYETLMFQEQLVKKGGNKKGFLQALKEVSQPVMDKLKQDFRNLYSNNSENIVVLGNGLEFKESSNTSVEMQLNENKQTDAKEIFELFLLNLEFMQGKVDEKTYNSTFKVAILPMLRMIECALNKDLLLEREKVGEEVYFYAFDTREILKGDLKSRYDAYKVAIDGGFKKIDEVRYMENDKAFGIDWINLGLNSVLYDTNTKEIYTPNTGKSDTMDMDSVDDDINDANDDIDGEEVIE